MSRSLSFREQRFAGCETPVAGGAQHRRAQLRWRVAIEGDALEDVVCFQSWPRRVFV
jgi:hypothetical protein